MGRNIGEVDFLVDFDGRGLPGKARKMGAEAGGLAGEGFNEGFSKELTSLSKELRDDMRKNGELAGISFTDSMQGVIRRNKQGIADELADIFGKTNGLSNFVKQTGDADTALGDLRDKMRELNEAGGLSTQMYDNLNGQLDAFEKGNLDANRAVQERISTERDLNLALDRRLRSEAESEDRLRTSRTLVDRLRQSWVGATPIGERFLNSFSGKTRDIDEVGNSMDRLSKKVDKASGSGRRFKRDFNFNQLPDQLQDIIFIGAIIAALGTDIAVLGSAAGGGLAALGIGALAAVTGVGVLIAGIKGITGPIEDIEPAARPAALALRELGKGFVSIKKEIQGRLFADLAPDIENLGGKLLPVLSKGFGLAADAGNRFFRSLATKLTTPKALEDMDRLLTGFEPILDSLFNTLISLGAGIGSVFVTGIPTAQKFFGYIEDITGEFARWSESEEGRERILQWFSTAERVGPKVARLLGAVGDTLAGLVTTDTITKLNNALEGLADLMPAVGGFLDTIGKLDPIGLFVAALQTVADILSPLKPALDNLATSLNGNLKSALGDVKGLFEKLSPALAPVVDAIADDLIPALIGPDGLLSALLDLVEDVLPELSPALVDAAGALADIAVALADVLPALKPVLDLLTPAVADGITGIALAIELLTTNWEDMDELFASDSTWMDKLMAWGKTSNFGFFDWLGTALAKATIAMQNWGRDAGKWADDLDDTVNQALEDFWKSVGDWFVARGKDISSWFKDLFKTDDGWAADLNDTVNQALEDFWSGVGDWFAGIGDDISTWLGDAFGPDDSWSSDLNDTVNQALEDFWTGIGDWFADRADDVSEWFMDLFAPDDSWASDLNEGVNQALEDFWTGITDWFAGLDFGALVTDLFSPGEEAADTSASNMTNSFGTVAPGVQLSLGDIGTKIAGWFEQAPAPVQTVASTLGQLFADPPNTIRGFLGTIGTSIAGWFQQAPAPVQGVANQIGQIWATPPTTIRGFMGQVGQSLIAIFQQVPGPVGQIASQVGQIWANPPTTIRGFMSGIGQTIGAFFQPAIGIASAARDGIVAAWRALPGLITGALSGLKGVISSLLDFSGIRVKLPSIPAIRAPQITGLPQTAVGGVFGGGQARIIAEAGPEAVVPLNRPLSQVDPAVRDLSAYAQGLAGGGSGDGQRIERQVIIEEGAVRVVTVAKDPGNVGAAVLDELVANLP